MLGFVLDRRLTFKKTFSGGDLVVQFSCTSHPPYTPLIVDRSGTHTGLHFDSDDTGLSQVAL